MSYSDPNVHYRLYRAGSGPEVVRIDNFDYFDYHHDNFLSSDKWATWDEAQEALAQYQRQRSGKLMLRALVAEELKPGDVVDVVQDPLVGTLTVVKYRPPFD